MTDEKPKLRVLVVDDNMVLARLSAEVLTMQGYDASAAYNGETAVELARSFRPDMLISDVIMEGINGFEAAIFIREFLPSIRVLLYSSYEHEAQLWNAHVQGHDFELTAIPLSPRDLLHWCEESGDCNCDWCQALITPERVTDDHKNVVSPSKTVIELPQPAVETEKDRRARERTETIEAILIVARYAIAAAIIVFFLLGVETHRAVYTYLHDSLEPWNRQALDRYLAENFPKGNYYPIVVLGSSAINDGQCCKVEVETLCTPAFAGGKSNLRLSAECNPRFWNHCRSLTPEGRYYAQWSSDHSVLTIGEAREVGTTKVLLSSRTANYDVPRWDKAGDCEVSPQDTQDAATPVVQARDLP